MNFREIKQPLHANFVAFLFPRVIEVKQLQIVNQSGEIPLEEGENDLEMFFKLFCFNAKCLLGGVPMAKQPLFCKFILPV
jgi:hypothetical protein